MNRSPHSEQFRRDAAARVARLRETGVRHPTATVARDLGVNADTLRDWVDAYTATPMTPPAEQPGPLDGVGSVGVAGVGRLVLEGIAVHAACATPLTGTRWEGGLPGYWCARCSGARPVSADTVHRLLLAAVASRAPRLGTWRALPRLPQVLASVKVDDRGQVVSLTWRPTNPPGAGPARQPSSPAQPSSPGQPPSAGQT